MILKFPGTMSVNNQDILKDVKMNIDTAEKRARFLFTLITKENAEKPFDIVVMKWKTSFSPPGSVNIEFIAVDWNSKKEARGTASFAVLTKKWTLKGKFGERDVNISSKGLAMVSTFFNDILLK